MIVTIVKIVYFYSFSVRPHVGDSGDLNEPISTPVSALSIIAIHMVESCSDMWSQLLCFFGLFYSFFP